MISFGLLVSLKRCHCIRKIKKVKKKYIYIKKKLPTIFWSVCVCVKFVIIRYFYCFILIATMVDICSESNKDHKYRDCYQKF